MPQAMEQLGEIAKIEEQRAEAVAAGAFSCLLGWPGRGQGRGYGLGMGWAQGSLLSPAQAQAPRARIVVAALGEMLQ